MQEEKEVTILPYAVRFGIIGGLIWVILSVLLFILDVQFEWWSKLLPYAAISILLVYGAYFIKSDNAGKEISFGTQFNAGFITTAIIALITVLYFFIYIELIDPDFINSSIEASRQKMIEYGRSEAQIENAMEISKKIMSPGLMASAAALTIFLLGSFISVISAAIFKQEK